MRLRGCSSSTVLLGSGRVADVLLKVCVNGARLPEEHPALPVTPIEIARDCATAQAEGAQAVHLHVKDERGRDTFAPEPLAAVLRAVRTTAPKLRVGVTTGAWASPDPGDRVRAINRWTAVPDFASVNWHETGADDVAAALLKRGVAVEAALWHDEAVAAWAASPLRERCLRVLIELPDGPHHDETVTMGDRLLASVRAVTGDALPVLLHGEGSSTWPALRRAAELGLATRIGLEDTLTDPDGRPVRGNAELVHHAVGILQSVSR